MKRLMSLCALAILTLALASAAPGAMSAPPSIVCVSPSTLDPAWGNGTVCV